MFDFLYRKTSYLVWIAAYTMMCLSNSLAQNSAKIYETSKDYPTYSFADPSMLANFALYPYFRFDGFSTDPANKAWKVVVLENDFIKVQVMPEIGGKVWTAIDKATNKSFLYNNDVVKFRDIALRGPWVSGGIEFNFGIIGHTPSSSSPVDYLIKSYDDGSVACFISNIELISRTRWIVQIKLEKDKSYFETKMYWINLTNQEQPFYSWSNAAVNASENLRFVFPGNKYIGHAGEVDNWPIDSENRDLSYYRNNAFGSSKSYHVTGVNSSFFGVIDSSKTLGRYGTVHLARRDGKLGKKIFLWSHAGDGKIWEDLLTDGAGQYVEIQSGKLFNQNVLQSSKTPYKQHTFSPYETEVWSEFWFPIKGLDQITNVNQLGAIEYIEHNGRKKIKIASVQHLDDSIWFIGADRKVLAKDTIRLSTNQTHLIDFDRYAMEGNPIGVKIGPYDFPFQLLEDERPVQSVEQEEAANAQYYYLSGRDHFRFRELEQAESLLNKSLEQDSLFVPALIELAKLNLSQFNYEVANSYLEKVLAIDTYHAVANFYRGLAFQKINKAEGLCRGMFEVASLSPSFRKASYLELGKSYLRSHSPLDAQHYFQKALELGQSNLEALHGLYFSELLLGNTKKLLQIGAEIEKIDPFSLLLHFEQYHQHPSKGNKEALLAKINNEFPAQTLMEMGIWFVNVGLKDRAIELFKLCEGQMEALYWLAWLHRDQLEVKQTYFAKISEKDPVRVFPFREEEGILLKWALGEAPGIWQTNYLLALLSNSRGDHSSAKIVLGNIDMNSVSFPPCFILKAQLGTDQGTEAREGLLKKAYLTDPNEWRYTLLYSKEMFSNGKRSEAIQLLEDSYTDRPDNYTLGFDLIKMLAKNNQFIEAEKYLQTIQILPFEGAQEARNYYRYVKLMQSIAYSEKREYKKALMKIDEAELWPINLGVGKPYSVNLDLENALRASIYGKMKKTKSQESAEKLVNEKQVLENTETFIEQLIRHEDNYLF